MHDIEKNPEDPRYFAYMALKDLMERVVAGEINSLAWANDDAGHFTWGITYVEGDEAKDRLDLAIDTMVKTWKDPEYRAA